MKGKVDLSLRLSMVNPEAAKKLRKKQSAKKQREEKKVQDLHSDGESLDEEEDAR